jgi:prepilin-type N-terminal cleavage/methylation domain-containing protein
MIKRIQTLRASDSGFTLIELLIVIVVLGILAGIVVFGVSTFRADAQLAACKADLKTVSVASDAYYAKYGVYEAIGAAGSTNVTVAGPPVVPGDLVGDKYLKTAPAATSLLALDTATGVVTSTFAGGLCIA